MRIACKLAWRKSYSPWLSWLLFSRLEPEIKGILGMGGGVGVTICKLLRARPGKVVVVITFVITFTLLTSFFPTLLSVVGVSITGHAGGEPPSQAGPLSLGTLVFHILPVPDYILLPLQLSDHHEELIFKCQFAFRQVFILLLNSSVMAVLFLQLQL